MDFSTKWIKILNVFLGFKIMIKIEMFINEVSLQGQYSTQKEFEEAARVIKSIFEDINKFKNTFDNFGRLFKLFLGIVLLL